MWSNWSGGQSCRPTATVRPLDEAGVSGVVRRAAERGQTVRALGAGHSFSALAVTDDVHVDLSALTGITGVHRRADGRTTVRVRGATTLAVLHAALDERGLALGVPLEIGTPTVAGALAVGMHGSGATVTSFSDRVVAMRIVDGRGQVRDVASGDLDAARCGLGALGVVLDVELAVVSAGGIRVTRAQRPVDEVLDPAFWDAHLLAEAALFPSASTAVARWADAAEPPDAPGTAAPPVDPAGGDTAAPGSDDPVRPEATETASGRERHVGVTTSGATGRTALGGAVAVEWAIPGLVPRLNRVVSRFTRGVTATGAMHRVLSEPPVVRYEQTEWALPRAALADAVREVLAVLAGDLETGLPVRMRLGAPETGWLHPAHGRETGWVAVRVPRGTDPEPVLTAAARVLAGYDGRPHWASRHVLGVDDIEGRYPRLDDFRRVRDDYDPARVFANPALEALLGP